MILDLIYIYYLILDSINSSFVLFFSSAIEALADLYLPQPWKDCQLCPKFKQALQYGSEPSIILPVPGLIGNPVVESIAKPAYSCSLVFDMALFSLILLVQHLYPKSM